MTKIDVFSGFLGAGKTTLIKKLLKDAYKGQKVVLIENEFGEIGIDGGFMKEAGIQVTEMNSGCICCSLVGDFGEALQKVLDTYHPDRILIEPSGVGKLSDVVRAASAVCGDDCVIGSLVAVVDAGKCKVYAKNFGEFFINQIEHAATVILSRTDIVSRQKIDDCVALVREHNPGAVIVTTPVEQLDGQQILNAMEKTDSLEKELEHLKAEAAHHHDEDDECDDPDCECHHHHHHDDDEEEKNEHHHHRDDDDDDEHEHHHHHHHDGKECDDPDCECHHHHDDENEEENEHHHHCNDEDEKHEHHHHHLHDGKECDDPDCECHHHHHHADEVFTSWGTETPKLFTEDALRGMLDKLEDAESFGVILRAKGILPTGSEAWIHFDYTPGEIDIRHGGAEVTGRLCVIGSGLKEEAIKELFGV